MKNLKDKLYDYINDNGWSDETREQARIIFTTYCYSNNIDIDGRSCDETLSEIYWLCELENFTSYEDFVHFMFLDLIN